MLIRALNSPTKAWLFCTADGNDGDKIARDGEANGNGNGDGNDGGDNGDNDEAGEIGEVLKLVRLEAIDANDNTNGEAPFFPVATEK